MKTIVIYDIPSDKLRTKVADICLDYGLERIQFSAFFGELNANRQGELLLKIKRRIGRSAANVQFFPLCDKDVRLRKVIEEKGDGGDGNH